MDHGDGAASYEALRDKPLDVTLQPILAIWSLRKEIRGGSYFCEVQHTDGSKGLGLRPGGRTTVAADSSRSRAVVSTPGCPLPTVSVMNRSST